MLQLTNQKRGSFNVVRDCLKYTDRTHNSQDLVNTSAVKKHVTWLLIIAIGGQNTYFGIMFLSTQGAIQRQKSIQNHKLELA